MQCLRLALVLALLVMLAAPVRATTIAITPDNTWHVFDVDSLNALSSGLEWIDFTNGSPLTFALVTPIPVVLTVVDAGFGGDRFQVFDNGQLLGETSSATDTYPVSLGLDFDAALADTQWSRGIYLLSAGQHNLTGLLSRSAVDTNGLAFDATVGALQVAAVPEPANWLLLLSGLVILSGLAYHRTHAVRKDIL